MYAGLEHVFPFGLNLTFYEKFVPAELFHQIANYDVRWISTGVHKLVDELTFHVDRPLSFFASCVTVIHLHLSVRVNLHLGKTIFINAFSLQICIITKVNVYLLDANSVRFYLTISRLYHWNHRNLVLFLFNTVLERLSLCLCSFNWKMLSLASSLGSCFLFDWLLLDFLNFDWFSSGFWGKFLWWNLVFGGESISLLIRWQWSVFIFERIGGFKAEFIMKHFFVEFFKKFRIQML